VPRSLSGHEIHDIRTVFELQLSCVDRLLPKICLNYKDLLLSSPWHLESSVANLAFFPRIWACFFVELRFFFEDLRVACFWTCFNWNLLVFCRFLFCILLFFQILWHFCRFNLLLKAYCACFCENLLILGLFFRIYHSDLFSFSVWFFILLNFPVNAFWACFSVKLPIFGLFFKFTCLFLQNNLVSLLEGQIWWTLGTLILLGKSEK